MKQIEERIATLTAEKEEMHKEYLSSDDDQQNVIAMGNMRISMELKFLSELKQALVMGRSEQLTAFTEWLKDNHSIEIHDMILKDYIAYGG